MVHFKRSMIAALVLLFFVPLVHAQRIVGEYRDGACRIEGEKVRYFAVAFRGPFVWWNMERAAEEGKEFVRSERITHMTGYTGRKYGGFGRNLVIGFVVDSGQWHWTAIRFVGHNTIKWADNQGHKGVSSGWVYRNVSIPGVDRTLNYKFSGEHEQFIWRMKCRDQYHDHWD